jgi:hypothetical protein
VLSKHDRVRTAAEVIRLITDSCITPNHALSNTRDTDGVDEQPSSLPADFKLTTVEHVWIEQSITKITALVDVQLTRFRNDLTGHGVKGAGLLHDMLSSFFAHVVHTAAVADAPRRARLEGQLGELEARIRALVALRAHGATMRNDAAQLGKAMTRRFESALLHVDIMREAGQVVLPAVERRMRPQPLRAPREVVPFSSGEHQFARGDREHAIALVERLKTTYELEVFKRDGVMFESPSLFECVAQLLWKQPTLDSFEASSSPSAGGGGSSMSAGGDGGVGSREGALAQRLRSITAAQMSYYYRRDARSADLKGRLNEPVSDYLHRLRAGESRGDLLCLWHLSQYYANAAHLNAIRFRVWLPGADLLASPVLVPQPCTRADYEAGAAFDFLVSSSPATGSSSVSASGPPPPPASAHAPLFIPTQPRVRVASFSNASPQVRDYEKEGGHRYEEHMSDKAKEAYRKQHERKRARLQ